MVRAWNARAAVFSLLAATSPAFALSRHVLLDRVLSDNPPPGQSDASCAHLVRAGLDEGVDSAGRPLVEPEVEHLIKAMRLTWWQCASEIANALAKYGSEVDDAFQMEQRSITKSLNQIKSALEKGKPVQSISPAFEWAQSGDWVYINAKMSHKLDAPATLDVVSEGVQMGKRTLKFAASKDQKRFELDLALHADIDPEPSTISFGSVGRVTFTLKKAKGGVKWPTLLDDTHKRPVNMHVWWAKQEEYSDELDDLEDAAAAAKEEAASGGADSADVATTAAAAAAAEGKPLTAEARLQKAQKEAEAVLNKEKKSRMEELENEKRAVTKTIDADAAAKKKEAEDVLRAKKASVDQDFDELMSKKRAEVEAAHAAGVISEL